MNYQAHNIFKKFVFGCALAFMPLSAANAVTIAQNTTYDLTGDLIFVAETSNGGVYLFYGGLQTGSTFSTGALNSGVFSDIDSTMANIQFNIYDFNAAGQTGAKVGTATGTMDIGLSTVRYSAGAGAGAAIANEATGGGDLVGMIGTINGNAFNFTTALAQLPTRMPDGLSGGIYDNVNSAFPQDYSLVFGNLGNGFGSDMLDWFDGHTSFLGQNVYLHGDLHGRLSGVPEPATMGLLSMACLGGLARRRRRAV